VLNIINRLHTHGHLVVEVICQGDTPSGGDAVAACAGFTPQVAIPKAGDHVRVTGAYVTDRDNGWNEIHPVTRIEILQKGMEAHCEEGENPESGCAREGQVHPRFNSVRIRGCLRGLRAVV
jgi:hypothetical protein